MYIDDFFHSLPLLQLSSSLNNVDIFKDKQYIQIMSCDQADSNIQCVKTANGYLVYNYNNQSYQLYEYQLDELLNNIKQLSEVRIVVPADKAIYLEAAILEAIYLYDQLIENHQTPFIDLLLPLSYLYNLLTDKVKKDQTANPMINVIPCLHDLFIARFYYFIIQYCYIRFQCQQNDSLTHPYHFKFFVQNKLEQYLNLKPVYHVQDLTHLENSILEDYIQIIRNDS